MELPASVRWLAEVHLLQRSIVSEDLERTVDVLRREAGPDLVTHWFPCGSEAFTWIVPPRWSVRAARIAVGDRILVDAADHPLHLVTHSAPFRGQIDRDELIRHLHTDPARPDVIPYVYSFYRRDWGFCVPHSWLSRFEAARYDVTVDTELGEDRALPVAELTLRGSSARRIVLSAHLDHPGQVADGLSGVAALLDLFRRRAARPIEAQYFTLTFLFSGETIGALCYLARFEEQVRADVEACIAPEALANSEPLAFAESFARDTQLDRAAQLVFEQRLGRVRREAFLSLLANDDQVFDGPGFLIPSLSIARAPFPQYHSSADSLDLFDPERHAESVDLLDAIVALLDRNHVIRPNFRNIPFLSRYGLWFDWCSIPEQRNQLERFLRLMDGRRSLVDLCVESGLSLERADLFVDGFRRHDLVELLPPPPMRRLAASAEAGVR